MSRFISVMFAFILMLGMVAPLGAQDAPTGPAPVGIRPDAPPYAVHGPYWVGTMEFVIEPDSDRPLPLTIWYPALSTTQEPTNVYQMAAPPVPVFGHALADGEFNLADSPYPLILFSHGGAAFRYAAVYLTEHLASYGFVTMAMDHTGDTMVNAEDEEIFLRSHATRPTDVVRVLDFAETLTADGGALAGMIDVDHVAVTGHSSGAWTAFLAAGGRRDFRSVEAYCADHSEDAYVCATLLGQADRLAELTGLSEVPEGLWPSVGDPRVDAIVAMAPGNAPAFGAEGLAAIQTPAMVFIGTEDFFLPYDSFGPPTYEAIAGQPKAFVTFVGGGHVMYANACDAVPWLVPDGYGWCSDAVWDMDRAHDLINHFTTAFLLDTLTGDADAHAALAPDAMAFPGITYELCITHILGVGG